MHLQCGRAHARGCQAVALRLKELAYQGLPSTQHYIHSLIAEWGCSRSIVGQPLGTAPAGRILIGHGLPDHSAYPQGVLLKALQLCCVSLFIHQQRHYSASRPCAHTCMTAACLPVCGRPKRHHSGGYTGATPAAAWLTAVLY